MIELLVVIAIIALLSAVVLSALNNARSRARFTTAYDQMREIGKAAELDYDNRGKYAPDLYRDLNPGFNNLTGWPKPPCPGWTYDWDTSPTISSTRITLRRNVVSASGSGVYYYCIAANPATGNCDSPGFDSAADIRNVSDKVLTCNE